MSVIEHTYQHKSKKKASSTAHPQLSTLVLNYMYSCETGMSNINDQKYEDNTSTMKICDSKLNP